MMFSFEILDQFRSAALPEPTVARFVKLRLSGPHPPAKDDEQVK